MVAFFGAPGPAVPVAAAPQAPVAINSLADSMGT
jgi:hypothetical protein